MQYFVKTVGLKSLLRRTSILLHLFDDVQVKSKYTSMSIILIRFAEKKSLLG